MNQIGVAVVLSSALFAAAVFACIDTPESPEYQPMTTTPSSVALRPE